MQAMSDYLNMGGYAAFVWPAYGAAAIILVIFAIDSWRRVRQAVMALRRLEAEAVRQPAAARRAPTSGQA
jgi:heme exporter protein D